MSYISIGLGGCMCEEDYLNERRSSDYYEQTKNTVRNLVFCLRQKNIQNQLNINDDLSRCEPTGFWKNVQRNCLGFQKASHASDVYVCKCA